MTMFPAHRARTTPANLFALLALVATLVLAAPKADAMEIQQVTSPGGIKAWLVEEHGLPLMAMQFAFKGGASQDPVAKPGVANLMTAMLDEGAGDMKSEAFQERLEELAVRLGFSASRDAFTGNFQTLTENRAQAVELVRMALNSPRFDVDAIERMRKQILSGIVFDSKDPGRVAARAWYRAAFADHPYARPVKGTAESVAEINRDDLEAYRKRIFAKDNLFISVVGDITPAELRPLLDRIFGDLQEKAPLIDVPQAEISKDAGESVIEMDVPQSVATFGHAAFPRDDKDFIAAFVLNYIIGGGGFNSELMEEVREKRGLAYSVYSYLSPLEHGSVYLGGVATKNEQIYKTLSVIRDVLKNMAANGPTQRQLENAKKYLTGSYALRFDSSSKIASQLLWIQIEDLGIDYVDNRNTLINAVTLEEIRRVAARLLTPDNLIVTIVGKPARG